MHESARTANLLGATALAVSDLVLAGVVPASGTSTSGAAALVVLSHEPGIGVTELGRRVGLSQPAAARMVDALEAKGLVRRERPGGRGVAVRPTDRGEQAARDLLSARGSALHEALSRLDGDEQAALAALLDKLLGGLYRRPGDAERLCRLCDRGACLERGGVCPVGRADRACRAAASGGGTDVGVGIGDGGGGGDDG
jgi:DNA-binding MarR family transcriptional regulator